jgi:hypothetical protein
MRRSLRLMALALAVATTAMLAPMAHAADPQPPELPSTPPPADVLVDAPADPAAGPQPNLVTQNGTTYLYYDSDGWGSLKVMKVGSAYGTSLPLIYCQFKQNGKTLYGSGVSYESYLTFSIGNYLFQCKPYGWGSYQPAGSPKNQSWCFLGSFPSYP